MVWCFAIIQRIWKVLPNLLRITIATSYSEGLASIVALLRLFAFILILCPIIHSAFLGCSVKPEIELASLTHTVFSNLQITSFSSVLLVFDRPLELPLELQPTHLTLSLLQSWFPPPPKLSHAWPADFLVFLKEVEGFLPSWFRCLRLIPARLAYVFSSPGSEITIFRIILPRDWFPFLFFWVAVFSVLFLFPSPFDTLFTALLSDEYLLALALQHLVLLLLKSALKLLLSLPLRSLSFLLTRMLLPLLISQLLHRQFLHFHLT